MTTTSVQTLDASTAPGTSVQTNQERKAFDPRLPPLSLCTVTPTRNALLCAYTPHPQSHLMCLSLKFHFTSGLLSILPSLFTGRPIPPAPPSPHNHHTHPHTKHTLHIQSASFLTSTFVCSLTLLCHTSVLSLTYPLLFILPF